MDAISNVADAHQFRRLNGACRQPSLFDIAAPTPPASHARRFNPSVMFKTRLLGA